MAELARHWIDGEWAASARGTVAESVDPANGEVLGRFAAGDAADAESAIAAARRAFETTHWSRQPRLRATVLLEWAERLERARPEIVKLLTAENGKLLQNSEHELAASVSELRYYAGLARNIFGRVTELEPGLMAMLAREPMGVAGIIVPWNAPVTLLIRSLAPAIAAGCTAVIKAAPQTALVNERVFRTLAEITSIPKGAINMLAETGNEVAKMLVESRDVDIVSYTGSTEVGKLIMAAAAPTLKRLNLELGGSAPCVLFQDADLDQAVPALVRAGVVMAGQQCVAASRLLVHRSRLDEAQARFASALESVVVGPGDEPASEMGPMIDVSSRDRVCKLVQAARESDEVVLAGRVPAGRLAKGAFVTPSLVHLKDSGSPLLAREIFGPVLTLDTFESEEEAVRKANTTRFGLAAGVWTRDLQRAQRVASCIKSGTVWINGHARLHAEVETGGYKESGLGRLHGVEGLEAFLQTKHVSWELGSAS